MRKLIVSAMMILAASSAGASTYVVHADGSGDFPTIQAAIDGSTSGDTILLGAGTFTGFGNSDLDINRPRLMIGVAPAGSSVIDAGGGRLAVLGEDPDASEHWRFENIEFRNGDGIDAFHNKQLEFEACRFVACSSIVFVWEYVIPQGSVQAVDCEFSLCQGDFYAPTVLLQGCTFSNCPGGLPGAINLTATDCRFTGCGTPAGGYGGVFELSALVGYGGHYAFDGCVFSANTSDAVIQVWPGNFPHLELTGCTFAANGGAGSADLFLQTGGGAQVVTIDRCLFAFRDEGPAIVVGDGAAIPTLTDCDIYGNPGGDWTAPIASQLGVGCNMSANPQFCDLGAGDLTLYGTSPCLPANNGCGVQIGAEGQGCTDPTAVGQAPAALGFSAQPNPFNPKVRLRFALASAARVDLTIYDASGRRVATLLEGAERPAGENVLDWDAEGLSSGVYLARVLTPAGMEQLKLTLLR